MTMTALLAGCATPPEAARNTSGTPRSNTTVTHGEPTYEFELNVGDRVFFETDKSTLTTEAQATVARQVAYLTRYPDVKFTIEGHCDERGTQEYNLALGERRANVLRRTLIALGIDRNRIRTLSYGKEQPAVLGSTESAWSQNRRAVIVFNWDYPSTSVFNFNWDHASTSSTRPAHRK